VTRTGRRPLFVNEFNTSHFVKLEPKSNESEDLLQLYLFSGGIHHLGAWVRYPWVGQSRVIGC